MTQAEKIMNPTMMDSTQMYVGYHGHVLTSPIANGTIINGKPPRPLQHAGLIDR